MEQAFYKVRPESVDDIAVEVTEHTVSEIACQLKVSWCSDVAQLTDIILLSIILRETVVDAQLMKCIFHD